MSLIGDAKKIQNKFESYGDGPLTIAIIIIAIVFIILALTIHNVYVKAALLAYIILP
jgi:hypothetical protein